jgi:hypothetical protein
MRVAPAVALLVLVGCAPAKLDSADVKRRCVETAARRSPTTPRDQVDRFCGCMVGKVHAAGYTDEEQVSQADAVTFARACRPALNSPEARSNCVDAALHANPGAARAPVEQYCGCVLDKAVAAGITDDAKMTREQVDRFAAECRGGPSYRGNGS